MKAPLFALFAVLAFAQSLPFPGPGNASPPPPVSNFIAAPLTDNTTPPPQTAAASSSYPGFLPFNAFSGHGTTDYWIADANTGWISYDCGPGFSGVLGTYAITIDAPDSVSRAPNTWQMQGSNDNSIWTTVDTRSGITWSSGGTTKTYTAATQTTAYRHFRLNITANNGDSYIDISNLALNGVIVNPVLNRASGSMTSDTAPPPFVASASSSYGTDPPWQAFDNTWATAWVGTEAGTDWLEIDLGAGNGIVVSAYSIWSADANARAPKNWTLQGSNDNSTWNTVDTQTNGPAIGSGTNGSARTYVVGSPGAVGYRYWRIDITANNGDPTYTSIAWLQLYGVKAVASAHYVTLAWTDSVNPAPPATLYRAYRADASDCTGSPSFAPIVSGVVAKTYNDTHVASGVNYCYYVTAYNTVGESAPSGAAAAAIP